MKTCTKCLVSKPLEDYYKEKRFAIGYQAQCKECMRNARRAFRLSNPSAEREYYLANKERIRKQVTDKYHSDEIHRESVLAKAAEYKRKNRKKLLEQAKAYGKLHAEKRKAYLAEYRKRPENIERSNAGSRKYRSKPENKAALSLRSQMYKYRKEAASGTSTKAQLKARWDYYGGKCWICDNTAREMDHVKPLTKGGSHWPGNLRPICRSCNARKSNTWPYQKLVTNSL